MKDFLGNTLKTGDYVFCSPTNTILKVCVIQKFNKKTISVKDTRFKNGTCTLVLPENTVLLGTEDLLMLKLQRNI